MIYMTEVTDWFSGLATIGGFAYFLSGFGCAYLVHCAVARFHHTAPRIPWHLAGIAIGTVAIVIVSLQSSSAYNIAKQTAIESQQCQQEFNSALRARAKITSENDELSQVQRQIIFDWIHSLIFPPPPYSTMSSDDQRRQDYGITLTINTSERFQRLLDRQTQLQSDRDAHPYPDPTCGK